MGPTGLRSSLRLVMSEMINGKTVEQIFPSLYLCRHPHTWCKRCAYYGEILCDDKLKRDTGELIMRMDKTIEEQNALLAAMDVSVPEGRRRG